MASVREKTQRTIIIITMEMMIKYYRAGDGSSLAASEDQNNKKRRLNMEQVKTLEKSFKMGKKLEPERKAQLARALELQPRQIAIWFQNRRARWSSLRKSMMRSRHTLMLSGHTMMLSKPKTKTFSPRYAWNPSLPNMILSN